MLTERRAGQAALSRCDPPFEHVMSDVFSQGTATRPEGAAENPSAYVATLLL